MNQKIAIQEYTNISTFLKVCTEFLSSRETFYNLKLGIAHSILDSKIETTSPLYFGLYENEKLVGCALRSNHDRPLALSIMPLNAVDELISFLILKNISLHGVIGELQTATYFRDQWILKNNLNYKLSIHLGVYEADKILSPKDPGMIIPGTENEKAIIFQFVKGFCQDCFPDKEHTDENIHKLSDRHIKNQSLYLLKNEVGEIVSMAANTRGSQNSGTVSLVYTPNHLRGKGYASKVTALVSEKILQEKKFASLFTDLTNPTSNSIYQKIGYRKIGENIHFDFIEK